VSGIEESSMKRPLACAASLATALWVGLAAAQLPVLIVKEAWVRQTPGADVAAVYLNLRNVSAKPIIVVGVQSPLARHAMIHETSLVAGKSQMRMRDKIVIAPGQTTKFAPGGVHIMLSGLKQKASVGKNVPLVLLLADGEQVAVAAVVKASSAPY
jgi:periplasmic copper chaperone A